MGEMIKNSLDKKKLIVSEVMGSYEEPCRILQEEGWEKLDLIKRQERPIQSKGAWLKQGIHASVNALRKLGVMRRADRILMIGNYSALFMLLLNKLHLLHPTHLYWWGFFMHSEKMQKLFRIILKLIYSSNVSFIIFSRYEKELYSERLAIRQESFISLPYGDWKGRGEEGKKEKEKEVKTENEISGRNAGYYFAGGYSNRDYGTLIKAWERIEKNLIIIGSKNNSDLMEYMDKQDNPHIKVLTDVSSEVFGECLMRAKASIMPFKSDTGASGQTVALRCMKAGKIMISQDIQAMKEYIKDNETGFLVHDMVNELPAVVEKIEAMDDDRYRRMVNAQTKLFKEQYAYEAIREKLKKILK